MKGKVLAVLLCAAMAISMTACSLRPSGGAGGGAPGSADASARAADSAESGGNVPSEPVGDPVTLVYAEVNPLEGTIAGQTSVAFKDKVEELSGGSITIDIHANGELGDDAAVVDAMMGGGAIDMARISTFALTSHGGEKSMLLSLPYTFASRDHFWNFAKSDLAQEFLLEPHENGRGVRGLFYGEEGFRHFFTARQISGIEDLKGMKIRVADDPIMNGLVEGLGATPTVVPMGDLYFALQTGVVDAAEQPIANYQANAFPEVANTMILDGHTLGAIQVIITDEAWDGLSLEQQECMMEAADYASDYNHMISQETEDKILKELRNDGGIIIEVTDTQPWRDACADVIEENIKGQEDLYQQILDMQ